MFVAAVLEADRPVAIWSHIQPDRAALCVGVWEKVIANDGIKRHSYWLVPLVAFVIFVSLIFDEDTPALVDSPEVLYLVRVYECRLCRCVLFVREAK